MTLTVKKKLPRDLGIPSESGGSGGINGVGGGGVADTTMHNTTLNSSSNESINTCKMKKFLKF